MKERKEGGRQKERRADGQEPITEERDERCGEKGGEVENGGAGDEKEKQRKFHNEVLVMQPM